MKFAAALLQQLGCGPGTPDWFERRLNALCTRPQRQLWLRHAPMPPLFRARG